MHTKVGLLNFEMSHFHSCLNFWRRHGLCRCTLPGRTPQEVERVEGGCLRGYGFVHTILFEFNIFGIVLILYCRQDYYASPLVAVVREWASLIEYGTYGLKLLDDNLYSR